jgi:hypothetical protein
MAAGKSMNHNLFFILWLLFLSCLIIPAAVIVNFNLGGRQFQIETAEYLAKNQIPASPGAHSRSLPGGVK